MFNNSNSNCLLLLVGTYMPHMISLGDPLDPVVTGTTMEVLEIFAQQFGVCFRFRIPEGNSMGKKLPNGSWTEGGMKMLIEERAAFTGLGVGISAQRAADADLSEYLYIDEWIVSYKRPVFQSDIIGFVKPFTAWAWCTIFVQFFIILLVSLGVRMAYSSILKFTTSGDRRQASNDFYDAYIWSFASLVSQASPEVPRGNSVRVVSGIWLLMSFILATAYRSSLKAMLILPKIELPFNNIEELINSDIPVWIPTNSLLHASAKISPKDSALGRLRDNFVGLDGPQDTPRGIRGLIAGEFAFSVPTASYAQVIHSSFSRTGRCDTYKMSEKLLGTSLACILLPKRSPWKPKIDNIIVRLREAGVMDHIYRKGVFNATECLKPIRSHGLSTLRPLDLGDFYGVFMVYAGGILAASVAFLLELISRQTTSSTTTNKSR